MLGLTTTAPVEVSNVNCGGTLEPAFTVIVTLEVVGAAPFKLSFVNTVAIAWPPTVPFDTEPESFVAEIGFGLAVTVNVAVGGVSVPLLGVPLPVATLVILPASRSACVTVCIAEQVALAFGTRFAGVQLLIAPSLSSFTDTPLIVTLPVFFSVYV